MRQTTRCKKTNSKRRSAKDDGPSPRPVAYSLKPRDMAVAGGIHRRGLATHTVSGGSCLDHEKEALAMIKRD